MRDVAREYVAHRPNIPVYMSTLINYCFTDLSDFSQVEMCSADAIFLQHASTDNPTKETIQRTYAGIYDLYRYTAHLSYQPVIKKSAGGRPAIAAELPTAASASAAPPLTKPTTGRKRPVHLKRMVGDIVLGYIGANPESRLASDLLKLLADSLNRPADETLLADFASCAAEPTVPDDINALMVRAGARG